MTSDGKIPPPNFGFGSANINDEIASQEEVVNFTSFLDETEQNDAKQRAIAEDEAKQRAAVLNEVIDEENHAQAARVKTDDDEALEKQKTQNLLRDRQLASKTGKQTSLANRKSNQAKEQEGKKNISKETVKGKPEEIEEKEELAEERNLESTKKQVTSRKGVLESADQEKENLKAADKAKSREKIRQEEQDNSPKSVKSTPQQAKQVKHLNENNNSTMQTAHSAEKPTVLGSQKAQHAAPLKSDLQKEFEKMAAKLIGQAQMLEDGDVIETTVLLNLEGSVFDQGEVVVTAYKYRPLEVNLKFKKFSRDAQKILRKEMGNEKEDSLKKVLKRNSLTVHQLELIED